MIHIYCGDGKGKTTAACGLAIRAAGSGMRVLFAQFFKSGNSSETGVLSSIEGIEVIVPEKHYGRYKTMTDAQRAEISECYREMMRGIIARAAEYDLIVLDEAVSVYGHGMIGRDEFLSFLRGEGKQREIVLTGRDPAPELIGLAHYVTEMRKIKHPFDSGVAARKGIEY